MAGISEEEFLRRKKERLAAKANGTTSNSSNDVTNGINPPPQSPNNQSYQSSNGKGKLIIIVVAAILLIGGIITMITINHTSIDTNNNSISKPDHTTENQIIEKRTDTNSNNHGVQKSGDNKEIDPSKAYLNKKEDGHLYPVVSEYKKVLSNDFCRQELKNGIIFRHKGLADTLLPGFINDCIKQNPRVRLEKYIHATCMNLTDMTFLLTMLFDGNETEEKWHEYEEMNINGFTFNGEYKKGFTPEEKKCRETLRRYLNKIENEDLQRELDEEEMEDHQDYLDSLKEKEEMEREQVEHQQLSDSTKPPPTSGEAAQLVFVRDITYKKQKKPSWLIFKDQKNRFCAVVTSSKYQILQETNYCIPFSGKDEDLKDSFAGNRIAEIDYPEHKKCKNVNTKSSNAYCNNFYQAFIKMAERENFVKLKEQCQSDKNLKNVCKYLE